LCVPSRFSLYSELIYFVLLLLIIEATAQWLALVAGGRAWTRFGSKKLEAWKTLENGDESRPSTIPYQDGGPSFFPKRHYPCPENVLLGRFLV
jgi:hypothetical protein